MVKKFVCLTCLIMILSLASNISADLVAHYKLDETSGTTVADSSGNG